MPAFALPASVEERLDRLTAEARRLRILSGAGWLVAVLLAAPSSAVALDAAFELCGRARGGLLALGVALALAAAWWFVVRRCRETLSPDALARMVEADFPNLAEQLRSLAEGNDPAGRGSRTMMALLVQETERRTKKLDGRRAAPSVLGFRLAALVAATGVLALAPLLLVSGGTERVRRVLIPWSTPAAEAPYEVVVSSGDPVVKRGQPITVSGYFRKTQPTAALPESATAVFREAGSQEETKLPMAGDDKSAFTLTWPSVTSDLEYRIESGSARSGWHPIQAVDPVEAVAGSEAVFTAPDYATPLRPRRPVPIPADIVALQHSKAELKLKLNRPAQAVQLEWRPNDAGATASVQHLPVQLDDARTTATADVPIRADGFLKWHLFAEKNVRTEIVHGVRAIPDAPPRFERVTGFPVLAREIRPGAEMRIDLAVADDLAVASLFVDYGPAGALDEADSKCEPVALPGLGTARAEGSVAFRLSADAAEGRAFRVRLRIQDNRALPESNGKPQQATYPDRGWVVLRVSSAARPLEEQEVAAKRDQIRQKLDAIGKLFAKPRDDLKALRLDVQGRPRLEQDHSVRLASDLEATRAALGHLEDLARASAGITELQALATLTRDLAGREVRTAELELMKVLTETEAAPRDAAALAALRALETALGRLGILRTAGEAAGGDWLDRTQLEQLAMEQAGLAEQAVRSPRPTGLPAQQRRLNEELQTLLARSEALRRGEAESDAAQTRKLGEELRRLSRAQQDLDRASRRSDADAVPFDELAGKQKRIAEKTKSLAEKTELRARLAQTAPLDPNPAQIAADWLDRKKPLEALTEQEKAARDLERLAEALAKAAGDRADDRKAIQQLSRWQDDLLRRVADGSKQAPRGDTPADSEKWTAEQQSLHDATRKLMLPPAPALEKAHRQARDATGDAAEHLKRNPTQAAENLRKASEALNQLAEKTPSRPLRMQAAALELDKLRKDQDAISREIDDSLRYAKIADDPEAVKKLAAIAAKQEELSGKLARLDAPGLEARRTRTTDASGRAGEAIQKGQPKEIAATQEEVRQQVNRLKQALGGQTPVDEQAGELARLQKELADDLATPDRPAAEEFPRLQRCQKEIARRLQQLEAPEAQSALQEAREAVQAAEGALRKPAPDLDDLRAKSQQAAAATRRLSEGLNKGSPVQAPAQNEQEVYLPRKSDADEALALAAEQRTLRDQLLRIAEHATKSPQPAGADPLKELARKQSELAKVAEQLARDSEAAGQPEAASLVAEAAALARTAGEKWEVGDGAGTEAVLKKLQEAARTTTRPELTKKAEELHAQQGELTRHARKIADDAGSRSARQQARQLELAKQSRELAVKLERPDTFLKPGPSATVRLAADGLKQAGTAMEQAHKATSGNKAAEASKARRQAAEALNKSQMALDAASGPPQPGGRGEADRAAAEATRQARDLMRQAEKELSTPDGSGASPVMCRAAKLLQQAAGKLGDAAGRASRE